MSWPGGMELTVGGGGYECPKIRSVFLNHCRLEVFFFLHCVKNDIVNVAMYIGRKMHCSFPI